jgi:DNA polymerase-3 subunit gamma/tau
MEQGVRADPLVQAVLARFPGAEIVGVRTREEIAAPPPAPVDPDEPPGGEPPPYDESAFGEHRGPDDVDDDF